MNRRTFMGTLGSTGLIVLTAPAAGVFAAPARAPRLDAMVWLDQPIMSRHATPARGSAPVARYPGVDAGPPGEADRYFI